MQAFVFLNLYFMHLVNLVQGPLEYLLVWFFNTFLFAENNWRHVFGKS